MTSATPAIAVPRPIEPGIEMEELARLHRDVSWTGTIVADGMGPGSPEMTATGSGVHERIQDGRWIVGTYEQDQFLPDGTFVLRWQLHWVDGWDPASAEYRAALADNYGHAEVMRGWIDGDRLTFETLGDKPPSARLGRDGPRGHTVAERDGRRRRPVRVRGGVPVHACLVLFRHAGRGCCRLSAGHPVLRDVRLRRLTNELAT